MNDTDPIKTMLNDIDGGRVLDVATSQGDFLRLLIESFDTYSEAVGIDLSEERITEARKAGDDGLVYEVMDATKLRYPDGYFDTVAIRHSLHHLADIPSVLNEMMRVLRPGGLCIVCEVYQAPKTERENSQRHLHHWWNAVARYRGESHNETFTRPEILKLIEPLNLTEPQESDFCEEYEPDQSTRVLGQMLSHTESDIAKLRQGGGPEELIRQGVELVARFGRLGFTNESLIYVIGRKSL